MFLIYTVFLVINMVLIEYYANYFQDILFNLKVEPHLIEEAYVTPNFIEILNYSLYILLCMYEFGVDSVPPSK